MIWSAVWGEIWYNSYIVSNQNQPQPFLEELFVRLMLNAMETSEALDWSQPEHRRQVAMLWQQLAEELLYHHFNHTFNFKNVIQNLSKAVSVAT